MLGGDDGLMRGLRCAWMSKIVDGSCVERVKCRVAARQTHLERSNDRYQQWRPAMATCDGDPKSRLSFSYAMI